MSSYGLYILSILAYCLKYFNIQGHSPPQKGKLELTNFPFITSLTGVEPAHSPPEGDALSTELQGHMSIKILKHRITFIFKSKGVAFFICVSYNQVHHNKSNLFFRQNPVKSPYFFLNHTPKERSIYEL